MYNAAKHANWARRTRDLALALQNLREESARLDAIYTNEALSGSDPAFDATADATKQEYVDMVNMMRDYAKLFANQAITATDRSQWISPFFAE